MDQFGLGHPVDIAAAKHTLALLLMNHPELAASDQEARRLLLEASNEGNWKSSVVLGILARDGKGEAPDPGQAWYYFHLARLQGGSACEKLLVADLKALESSLSVTEQADASASADAWFRQHRQSLAFVFIQADSNPSDPTPAVEGAQ
jgi:TPR repeat protein